MLASKQFFIVFLFGLIACSTIVRADSFPVGYDWHAADPLAHAHIVVRATIASIEVTQVTSEQLGEPQFGNAKLQLAVLHLNHSDLLRGSNPGDVIYAKICTDWKSLAGQQAILCAYWSPRLSHYLVPTADSVFMRDGEGWRRVEPQEEWSDRQVQIRLTQTQPQVIAQRAQNVVTGVITSVMDSVIANDGHYHGTITRISMQSSGSLKGPSPGKLVVFYGYSWVAKLPVVKAGEQWIAFLERKNGSLWVIDGTNGLLRVGDNETLYYDRVAPYSLTKRQLYNVIDKEVPNGN